MSHRCHIYIVKEKEMEFQSQAELLIHCGKSENNRNQVKRWIRDGKVRREGNLYIVEDERILVNGEVEEKKEEKKSESKDANKELKEEVARLRKENKTLKEENEGLKKSVLGDKDGYIKFSKLLSKDLYDHAKYFYERFIEWDKMVDGKVWYETEKERQRTGSDQINEDDVKEKVYGWYKFHKDEVDVAELEFMEDLIKFRKEKGLELPF